MKKVFKILSILLAMVLIFVSSLCINPVLGVFNSNNGELTVVIDAGHGGIDNGVLGTNTKVKEAELNLDVSLKLKKYFEANGINVVLTRSGDNGLYGLATKGFKKRDMKKRKEIIDKSNGVIVLSIHMNKCPFPNRRGAQIFYKIGSEKSKELANLLQSKFNDLPQAPRESQTLAGDFYILNCSKKVSVLCECGFLSNSQDEALLVSEKYREQLAFILYEGVFSFLMQNYNVKE